MRTGIKSVNLDPYVYYDVTENKSVTIDVPFLNTAIKKYMMQDWAIVADNILATQDKNANYVGNADYLNTMEHVIIVMVPPYPRSDSIFLS